MIDFTLWKTILNFIGDFKKNTDTSGILVCGSLIRGDLRPGSDIDILFLQKKIDFKMEIIQSVKYPVDRLEAKPELLKLILEEKTEFSDILSMSFGSSKLIVEDSPLLREIITIAEQNIHERNLTYHIPKNKEPHVIDGTIFTVSYDGIRHYLNRNGVTVI